MNKSALKKFAVEARRELLEKVKLQARKLGITAELIQKVSVESSDAVFIEGRQLSDTERKQRNKLITRINELGFDRVMDETAYIWFNRFVALRYMEVNEYLPTKVRVLSSNSDSAEPDMMKEALSLNLNLNKDYVYELKLNNKTDELFKYLIKMHCNDLNRYMPFMFERIDDYSEILFPEGLLGTDSFISQMIDLDFIPEDNWRKTEVIGWLYQYYIAEEKDRVFKAKNRYKAEEIPFATQLFTPDWIVRYMVQNSLGRYWTESHIEHKDLINNWELFFEKEEDFQEKITPYVNKELDVEEIKCFDPAMGSGHILLYMFDVLYEIYSKCGYTEREIPRLILENNLYGLDIDDRAYQLASFSVVMKALQYNRRFLRSIEKEGLTLNLAAIQETNSWDDNIIAYIVGEYEGNRFAQTRAFFKQYQNAKTFGSLIQVSENDLSYLEDRLYEIKNNPISNIFDTENRNQVITELPLLIKQTKIMSKQYDIVVMNPPYMGSGSMNKELTDFLKEKYSDSKADLFAAFMEVDYYLKQDGLFASINQHSWMFLSSFKNLREKIIKNKFIDTMLHLGPRTFEEIGGEVVQSTAFVLRNTKLIEAEGKYLRLIEEKTSKEKQSRAIDIIKKSSYIHSFQQENFSEIPGNPIAYWASENIVDAFKKAKPLSEFGESKKGLDTSNNDKYLKMWYEISKDDMHSKWFPLSKGGRFRKWYGNQEYLINWKENGKELKGTPKANIRNERFYFQELISWSDLTSGAFGARYYPEGFIFEATGPSFICDDIIQMLGFMNSNVFNYIAKFTMSTMHYTNGSVAKMPVLPFYIDPILIEENISISKTDWDSFETSWEFEQHPIIKFNDNNNFYHSFLKWEKFSYEAFNKVKSNEETLNRLFIEIYNLQDELSYEVADSEITIRKSNLERDVRSFISYAIGCSFGRYSLDKEGLICADKNFDASEYKKFPVNEDNIISVQSGTYFKEDVVISFVEFVRITFSEETLEENLNFIAAAIGRKKNETARESLRRYFLNDFYKDHVQVYKKRPIYWLFTSGKEKAFNCLIYMHRYDKTTLSRIRTDYLHEVQIRLDAEKKDLLDVIEGDSTTKEISNAKKELKSLDKKIDELKAYDELLHHMADMQIEIDLDDGVKVNYEKFKGLVAKI